MDVNTLLLFDEPYEAIGASFDWDWDIILWISSLFDGPSAAALGSSWSSRGRMRSTLFSKDRMHLELGSQLSMRICSLYLWKNLAQIDCGSTTSAFGISSVASRSNGFMRRAGWVDSAAKREFILHFNLMIIINDKKCLSVLCLRELSSIGGVAGLNVPCEFELSSGLISGVVSSWSESLILSSVERRLRRRGSPRAKTLRLQIGHTRRFFVNHGSMHLLW